MLNPTEEYLPGSEPSKKRKKKPTDPNLLGEEEPNKKKKKCKHENAICLTSMPPQWKCNDCGDIKMEFSELGKKRKKKPTGILKDLLELKRYELFKGTVETKFKDLTKEGEYVLWSDVEAIINKYSHP